MTQREIVSYVTVSEHPVPGMRTFSDTASLQAFAKSLPANEDIVRTNADPLGVFSHIRYLDTAPQREPEPFKNQPPTEKEFAKLCSERDKAREALDTLTTEKAGLPGLLDDAIAESHAPRIDHIKGRMRSIETELLLAEIAWNKARLTVLFAEKALAIEERGRLGQEAWRLGKENFYPEGKDAYEKARSAYHDARGVASGSEIANVRNRIAHLSRQLASA